MTVGEGGAIYRTAEGGVPSKEQGQVLCADSTCEDEALSTWAPVESGTTSALTDIAFVDSSHLWIAGEKGLVLRSTDGGVSWEAMEEAPVRELLKASKHPYTAGLLSCVPKPPREAGEVVQLSRIPGTVYSANEPTPDACLFVSRCPIAQESCGSQAPPVVNTGAGHLSRCLYSGDVTPTVWGELKSDVEVERVRNPTASLNPKRAAELLVSVGLDPGYLNRHPGELSGGEPQRVALAGAFAASPDIVVADEAVSALDVSVQAQVLNLLRSHQEETGTSYVFITHDLGVVRYLPDDILVLYAGHVAESGPAKKVLSALSPLTRRR